MTRMQSSADEPANRAEGRLTREQLGQFDGYPSRLTGYPTLDQWIHRLRGGWRPWKATAFVRYYTALIEIAKEEEALVRALLELRPLPPAELQALAADASAAASRATAAS